MKILIVTPSLNRADTLGPALQSVVEQQDPDLEHVVIDGGSTDGTAELVREQFPHVRLVVQPDRNLYEAINRGLRLGTGDVIGVLNSDDRLHPGALRAVRAGFAAAPQADAVCGGCTLHRLGAPADAPPLHVYDRPAMKALRAGDIVSGLVLTNGRFFRRHVFDALGGFDESVPTLADREFLARFHLADFTTAVIDALVYSYGCHAGSLTFNDGVSTDLLAEATHLARQRLAVAGEPRQQRFYRLWHGWAAGYECLHDLAKGRVRRALAGLGRASRSDPLWPAFFLRQLSWHLRTRAERS